MINLQAPKTFISSQVETWLLTHSDEETLIARAITCTPTVEVISAAQRMHDTVSSHLQMIPAEVGLAGIVLVCVFSLLKLSDF